MSRTFDPGPTDERFLALMDDPPGAAAYPPAEFRLEWGPIFYRGRLDGTARVLAIGQDPGEHECIARRILVGPAGRRVQGFLGRLGIDRSYVMVNAFLYCVYTKAAARKRPDDPAIAPDRDAWLEAIFATSQIEAVVTFGTAARRAYRGYLKRHPAAPRLPEANVLHPTSRGRPGQTEAEVTANLLENWNGGLAGLAGAISAPDAGLAAAPGPYGADFGPDDLPPIPAYDLPAGLPAWTDGTERYAERMSATGVPKRARIAVTVPPAARDF